MYRVYTVASGAVTAGAAIEYLRLKSAGIDIPVVAVGEEGRGRARGVIPIDTTGKPERLEFADLGKTSARTPKFIARKAASNDDSIIVVFKTKIGFRGGNDHTGDRAGWACEKCGAGEGGWVCEKYGAGEGAKPDICPKCGTETESLFSPFPGEIIARGRIAEGAAGRMGGGEQIVALIPREAVFRTAYSGRLYGEPSSHYYRWNGRRLIAATWNERVNAELF